ncbi:MAG: biotin/lipoyl-binding protein [Xanthomonadaceae bacterium]|nr:biotin/lipoyl-binding protein [Xanthomonadaceae bacterium]
MSEIKIAGKKTELGKSGNVTVDVRPGGWKIITTADGKRHRMRSVRVGNNFFTHIDGKTIAGSLVEKNRATGGAADEGLIPQYPGKVRKILVKEGETVKAGDSLILLEAMKMEFAIKAPALGKVKKWKIKEGENFSPGSSLLEFEESKK